MLFSVDSNSIMGMLQSFFSSKLKCNLLVSSSIIQSILWIILFIYTLRYYGQNINIDKKYAYIHKLEEEINSIDQHETLTREGKSYLNNYPLPGNITYYSYRLIIPTIYTLVILIKLYTESKVQSNYVITIFQCIVRLLCAFVNIFFIIESISDIKVESCKWLLRISVFVYIFISIINQFFCKTFKYLFVNISYTKYCISTIYPL